jgi:hypothetical protein
MSKKGFAAYCETSVPPLLPAGAPEPLGMGHGSRPFPGDQDLPPLWRYALPSLLHCRNGRMLSEQPISIVALKGRTVGNSVMGDFCGQVSEKYEYHAEAQTESFVFSCKGNAILAELRPHELRELVKIRQ